MVCGLDMRHDGVSKRYPLRQGIHRAAGRGAFDPDVGLPQPSERRVLLDGEGYVRSRSCGGDAARANPADAGVAPAIDGVGLRDGRLHGVAARPDGASGGRGGGAMGGCHVERSRHGGDGQHDGTAEFRRRVGDGAPASDIGLVAEVAGTGERDGAGVGSGGECQRLGSERDAEGRLAPGGERGARRLCHKPVHIG